MFASVNVVKFRLSNAVINVDEGTYQFSFSLKLVKSGNSGGCFLRNTPQIFGKFAEKIFVFLKAIINSLEKIVLIFWFTSDYFYKLSSLFEFSLFIQSVDAE